MESINWVDRVRNGQEKYFWGIEPGASRWQVLGGFDHRRLGLSVIKNVLEQEGWQVSNYYEKREQPLIELPNLDSPGTVVGISTITCTAPRAYELARQIKQTVPQTPIIMGGHPTACPDEALDYADIVVRGEGEETIRELLCSTRPLEEIQGISYWQTGVKKHNPERSLLQGLSYPTPLIDTELCKADVTPLFLSRGCPFKCTFCAVSHVMGAQVRVRPAEEVVKELKQAAQCGAKRVFIVDDNFFGNLDRAVELLERIAEEKIKMPIVIQMRADLRVARNPEILKLMKQAGIYLLAVGIESVEEGGLKELHKCLSLSQITEFISIIRQWQFSFYAMFVFGNLQDGIDTPHKILEFMRQYLPYELMQIMFLTPLPGTELYNNVNDRIFNRNWADYDNNHVVWQHPQMQPQQQYEALLKVYQTWYNPLNVAKILGQKILTGQWQAILVAPYFIKGVYHTVKEWQKRPDLNN